MRYLNKEYNYYLLQEVTIVYSKLDEIDILFENSYKDWKEERYVSRKHTDAKWFLKREVLVEVVNNDN